MSNEQAVKDRAEHEPRIMVVDDDHAVLSIVRDIMLEAGYAVQTYHNAIDALDSLHASTPDIILSDIKMPAMDGITFLRKVHGIDSEVPVILMTGFPDIASTIKAIEHGVFDFMVKPLRGEHLQIVIKRAVQFREMLSERQEYQARLEHTVKERTAELEQALQEVKKANLETILLLTRATEHRDDDTAEHIKRIGLYSSKLSEAIDMDEEFCEGMLYASPMHDVGKIGIPDSILLKPGPLTEQEFGLMKSHTELGAKMLSGSKSGLLKLAEQIALTHHERWDGTGYPRELRGQDIPLGGRIAMLADQYDALRSDRPYRKGFSHQDTFLIITEGDGRTMPHHFDPYLLRAFRKMDEEFNILFNDHQVRSFMN